MRFCIYQVWTRRSLLGACFSGGLGSVGLPQSQESMGARPFQRLNVRPSFEVASVKRRATGPVSDRE